MAEVAILLNLFRLTIVAHRSSTPTYLGNKALKKTALSGSERGSKTHRANRPSLDAHVRPLRSGRPPLSGQRPRRQTNSPPPPAEKDASARQCNLVLVITAEFLLKTRRNPRVVISSTL